MVRSLNLHPFSHLYSSYLDNTGQQSCSDYLQYLKPFYKDYQGGTVTCWLEVPSLTLETFVTSRRATSLTLVRLRRRPQTRVHNQNTGAVWCASHWTTNLSSDPLGIVADLRELPQAKGASNYEQLKRTRVRVWLCDSQRQTNCFVTRQ